MYRRRSAKSSIFKILIAVVVVMSIIGGLFYINKDLGRDIVINTRELITGSEKVSFGQGIKSYLNKIFEQEYTKVDSREVNTSVSIGKIAIISDSHSDMEVTDVLLRKVISDEVSLLIHLGDIVAAGDINELREMKTLLDKTGISYEVLPGDHDYNWVPEHNLANFSSVFGGLKTANRALSYEGFTFVFLSNSLQGASFPSDLEWLEQTLQSDSSKGIFVFTARPLVNPYFPQKEDALGDQILEILKRYNVKEVFSGDTHIFSRYTDEVSMVPQTSVGAAGSYKNPLPQYVLFEIFENGEYDIVAKPGTDAESMD